MSPRPDKFFSGSDAVHFNEMVSTVWEKFLSLSGNHFCRVGIFWIRFWSLSAKPFRSFYTRFLKAPLHKVDILLLRVRKWGSRCYKAVLYQIYHFLRFFVDAMAVVRNGYHAQPEEGVPRCLWNAFLAFCRGIRNNAGIFLRALNYLLPAATIAGFVLLVSTISHLNFAVGVEYNGEMVGYIHDESIYTDAQTRLQSRMVYQEDDPILYATPTFHLAVVDETELKTSPELTDTIIKSSSTDIVQATGITVDGEFLGAVKDAGTLRSTLDGILSSHRDGNDERVEFTKEVKLEPGLFLQSNLRSDSAVIETLTSNIQQNVYYTAVSGDTPSGIAVRYDMSLDDLTLLNPNILTELKIGQQVLVNKAEPYLPVKEIRKETYTESVDFETVYVDNANLYEGMTSTISNGKKGTTQITAEVSYIDGVEVNRDVLTRTVVTQPVAAKVSRGTMKMMVASGYENARKSSSGFVWPVSGGYISQYYGRTPYEYWHTGIDYAYHGNGYGQPIVASLPGTVTYAGWRGSYGKLVIVNHGNGIETWYAHCSSTLVRVGETVAQGEQIAKVGSSGNSSGNHCHFRVVVNGVEKNPLDYLP